MSQARSGANGRSRKRFCGLAVRHGAPRCPPVAGHRTRASLSAQSSRGNRAVSTRAGTGLPRSPRWREHGTQVREAASCRSNSCCGGGRAGAIGGARDGRPTPFRYLPIERGSVTAAYDLHAAPTGGAFGDVKLEHSGQKYRPGQPVPPLGGGPLSVTGGRSQRLYLLFRTRYDLRPVIWCTIVGSCVPGHSGTPPSIQRRSTYLNGREKRP